MEHLFLEQHVPVWISDGVLSEKEISMLRQIGIDLTTFSHIIEPNNLEQIEDAIQTIAEHHPGQRIWVEVETKK